MTEQPGTGAATGEAKALAKGLALLDAVASAGGGLTLTEVARREGLSKTTAHRLLATLVARGLVRCGPDGRYTLDAHCLVLADAFLEGVDLRGIAQPELRRLLERTAETCHLGVLSGTQVVYIDKVESPHPVRMFSRLGATNPAATTALGRAMLAFAPSGVVDAVYREPIPPRTHRTVTDPVTARERLADVRRDGIAVDDVENEPGIRCVAAPVLDHTGMAVAAISVSSPEHRLTPDALGEVGSAVRMAAEAVSRALGFRGPFPGLQLPSTGAAGAGPPAAAHR